MTTDPKTQTSANVIQEKKDEDRQYLIHPNNNDLFLRTGKQVIAHCQLGIGLETWLEEVKSLVSDACEWCRMQEGKIQACYIAPIRARITLYFVPATDSYDFDLGTQLVELNTKLVQNYNVGMIETRQIPDDEIERFIRPEASQCIYGERKSTHHTMDT